MWSQKSFLRIIALSFVAIQCTLLVTAQDSLDSLQIQIEKSQGKKKVDLLHEFIKKSVNSDPLKALEYGAQSLQHSKALNYEYGQFMSLKLIGDIHARQSRLDTAKIILHRALDLVAELNLPEEEAAIKNLLGGIYIKTYQYETAIEYYLQCLNLIEKGPSKQVEMAVLINLSIARRNLNDLVGAEAHLQEALTIGLEQGYLLNTGKVYGNLGQLEFDRGNFALARDYLSSSLETFNELHAIQTSAIILIELSRVEHQLNNFDKALDYLGAALEIRLPTNNQRGVVSIQRYRLRSLLALNRLSEVEALINKTLPIAIEVNDYAILMDLYEMSYQLNLLKNDPAEALIHYRSHVKFRDSLNAQTNRREAEKLTMALDRSRLESKAEIEKQKTQIEELKVAQRNFIIVILIIALLAFAIILLLNRQRLKHRLALSNERQQLLAREIELRDVRIHSQQEKISSFEEELLIKEQSEIEVNQLVELLKATPMKSHHWVKFRTAFEKCFPGFFSSLDQYALTSNENRLASLIRLGLSNKEMSQVLSISPNSVIKARSRLAAKLDLTMPEIEHLIKSL